VGTVAENRALNELSSRIGEFYIGKGKGYRLRAGFVHFLQESFNKMKKKLE